MAHQEKPKKEKGSPQIENGFIQIATELAEALARVNLCSYEQRYLWALWRKTYGWHKKADVITNSQFVDMTGIDKSHICRTEKKLIERNIIIKNSRKIAFNKHYKEWKELPKQATGKTGEKPKELPNQATEEVSYSGNEVAQTGNKKLPEQANTKDSKRYLTKNNNVNVVGETDFKKLNDFEPETREELLAKDLCLKLKDYKSFKWYLDICQSGNIDETTLRKFASEALETPASEVKKTYGAIFNAKVQKFVKK